VFDVWGYLEGDFGVVWLGDLGLLDYWVVVYLVCVVIYGNFLGRWELF